MAEYIEREALLKFVKNTVPCIDRMTTIECVVTSIKQAPAADVVEVVRCKDCNFATELDKHCDINRTAYKHCSLLRGDETRNVWHKYKKYYKDYSLVEADDFCSYGERKCEDG